MKTVFDIALVFSPHEWVEALHRHCTNTGDLRIKALVYDSVVLQTETFDACIIADSHPALSAGLVASLHKSGHSILGVCDDSPDARSFLSSIGVDAIFSAHLSAEELSIEIQEFLATTSPESLPKSDELNSTIIDDEIPEKVLQGTHLSFCVLGPGGTGATEIALNLSSRLVDAIIVDLDFEHPSIAPRRGLDIDPHLLGAIEASHNDPKNFLDNVQRLPTHSAIVGVSHASYARDIRNYELESLFNEVNANYSHSVFDLGRVTEDSKFFTHVTTIIERANVILVVGEPTPVGILRVLETVALAHSIIHQNDSVQICVVINKCSKDRAMMAGIRNELNDVEQISQVIFVPFSSELMESSWRTEITQPRTWKKPINELVNFMKVPA